jgi:lipopolysaccharide biosynthesis protein
MIPRIRRRIAGLIRTLVERAWAYFAVVIAIMRPRRDWIVERIAGERSLDGARHVAIFNHFDPRGHVHDYVLYYMQSLRAAGYEIVFVSNSERLNPHSVSALQPLCAMILCRKNIGYDFGAYKDALSLIDDLTAFDTLILANDSVYGPLQDLAPILARCDDSAAIWGITDSWSKRYHLQSYFLLFRSEALASPSMRAFWASVRHVQSKRWVITRYEIGLTQHMLRAGLRCAALYPYRAAVAALTSGVLDEGLLERKDLSELHRRYLGEIFSAVERGTPLNVMHHFWDHLIIRMRCPFVKRELLQRNPAGIPFIYRWEDAIHKVCDYDTGLIVKHMQSRLRDRSV